MGIPLESHPSPWSSHEVHQLAAAATPTLTVRFLHAGNGAVLGMKLTLATASGCPPSEKKSFPEVAL